MRPACFSPLRTELIHTYEWIKVFDVWGEEWVYQDVFWLHEKDDVYLFALQHRDGNIGEWEWPSKILVRVEYGPKVLDTKTS